MIADPAWHGLPTSLSANASQTRKVGRRRFHQSHFLLHPFNCFTMPARTRTAAEKPKPAWKDRLTEQQLNRKRAADRQLVRESRMRARQTVAVLEERLNLLVNQQSDKLVQEVMRANAALEQERDGLRQRFHAVCTALGLSREQSTAVLAANNVNDNDEKSSTEHDADNDNDQQADAADNFDLITELDARMLTVGSPSPYPEIFAIMGRSTCDMTIAQDDFLEAVILWRCNSQASPYQVFDLATKLFNVDRPPVYLTRDRLRSLAGLPDIMQMVVRDLAQIRPLSDALADVELPPAAANTTIHQTRKELVLCAFLAISPWDYPSKCGRLAMFWALYRILTLLYLPTAKNLATCPAWYWPVPSQMLNDHPSFIDFIPW